MERLTTDGIIQIENTPTALRAPTPAWRKNFKNLSEMDQSPMKFPIDKFLPEGITFFGATPASGKTWFCLSMAKALCTGGNFLGTLRVEEPSNVLYLIPEVGERQFRQRMDAMWLPDDDRFLCRTMSQGPLKLSNPGLHEAVKELKPVIILDTAIRFNPSDDENDARQSSKLLTGAIYDLLSDGARAVVCIHHSTKSVKKEPTLENCLRGTGDLAAMSDAVYYLEVKDQAKLKVRVRNVKARDFDPLPPFEVQGRPYINQEGDFRLVSPLDEPESAQAEMEINQTFLSAISANPSASYTDLQEVTELSRGKIQRIAGRLGYLKGDVWTKKSCEVLTKAA